MYPLVTIPSFANKSFFDFTKEEAKKYFEWFLSINEQRISILQSHVKQDYSLWKVDFTKESLEELYQWFKKKVGYRPMTKDEKEQVENQINNTTQYINVIPVPEVTFTEETVSICFDIAIYFGQTLIYNVPELKWLLKLTSTNYIYYGQPLLAKAKSKVPLNPRASIEGIARRILDRDVEEITFVMLYKQWVEKFKN